MRKKPFILILLLFAATILESSITQIYGKNMTNKLVESAGYSDDLKQKIISAYQGKDKNYIPRTRHLDEAGVPLYTNRLIMEDSPYLLQHAHNPVNWYAWGNEAFQAAKKDNKPIFLSIGYSTCHWCHVMEHESFENVEIARFLNTHYISIKVDRELRPDVDHLYMTAVTILNRQGGWPMSSFLTTDGKPFYGGTYYPPPTFLDLIQKIHAAWQEKQSDLEAQAEHISGMLRKIMASETKASEVGKKSISAAIKNLIGSHDSQKGGFGQAPKFPMESSLLLLIEQQLIENDPEILKVINTTLMGMARGGLYDQIGGGFHRYSTDADWFAPHFEKMLYNQAHLAQVYLKAYRLTHNPYYALIARETLDYVLRDMTSKDGGFYSATDADSEGVEGLFFLWTKELLQEVLTPEEADLVIPYYGVSDQGNFENQNLLNIPEDPYRFAESRHISISQLFNQLDTIKKKLYLVREQKIHPLRDEKIITGWNGMMITAFAAAGELLKENKYQKAAVKTAKFLWGKSRPQKGQLNRSYLSGTSSSEGTLDDYAYFSRALIELYDLTGDSTWLNRSVELSDEMISLFEDQNSGGFYMNQKQSDVELIVRPKEGNDGAIPSGNSMALDVLTMLYKRTGNDIYQKNAKSVLAAFSSKISEYPEGFSYMMLGASKLFNGEHKNYQYAASGAIVAKIKTDSVGLDKIKFEIQLSIKPEWHINADQPLQEDLVPTQIVLKNADNASINHITFPKSDRVSLGFQEAPLAVYTGDLIVTGEINKINHNPSPDHPLEHLNLTLQACNDSFCALPEVLSFPIFL